MRNQALQAQGPAIRLNEVGHRYRNSQEKFSLYIPSWELAYGERIFLYGESGTGKTTFLNLMAGVLTPQQGTIELLNKPFSNLSARQRDKFRARHIGVVFQQFNLIPYLTVLQNIQLAAYFANTKQKSFEEKVEAMLIKLKLPATFLHKAASELSVGQQQRVAIARSFINDPEILLVDEPTSALDASARDAFMAVLLELCENSGTTLIFVSHDMHLQHFFKRHLKVTELIQNKVGVSC